MDLEEYSAKDPSMVAVRDASEVLLKKRQEILDQEKQTRDRGMGS